MGLIPQWIQLLKNTHKFHLKLNRDFSAHSDQFDKCKLH